MTENIIHDSSNEVDLDLNLTNEEQKLIRVNNFTK